MKIHHIAFRVADLQVSTDFYRDILAFPVRREDRPRSVWLEIDDESVLMLETRTDGESSVPEGSMELVAFRVDRATKERIRDLCCRLGCFDGETEHTIYLRDPDGRRIGISTYPL